MPGFEDILDAGVNDGLYNIEDPLQRFAFLFSQNESNLRFGHRLVFCWIAIPYLQFEMDLWAEGRNDTSR